MIKNIAIVYASASGNTEAVAEKVSKLLAAENIVFEISRAEMTQSTVIDDNAYFVFGTSTWEHGRINPLFDKLLDYIAKNSMVGKKAAFVGLGDKSYEPVAFNAGMRILRETFLNSGGTELARPLIIDGDPFPLLDTKVPYWTEILIAQLKNEHTN
jgi:flavodoxin